MEIRHLEYFLEVARYKSFSKAAESVHISQSTISKAIKELEGEIGNPLFYRTTKYVQLTDVGENIIHSAEQIVNAFYNIPIQVEKVELLQTGKIHIGLPPITAITEFSRILSAFRLKYPKIQIKLYEYGPKKIESSLREGLLDIGIFTPDNSQAFEWFWFERDFHSVIMPKDHPLTALRQVGYENLRDEPVIIYNSDYKLHDMFVNGCIHAGVIPNIAFETSQKSFMIQMTQEGIGLSVLPRKICKKLPSNLTSRPFKDKNLCLELAMTWEKSRYLSCAARTFLEFAQKEFSAGH